MTSSWSEPARTSSVGGTLVAIRGPRGWAGALRAGFSSTRLQHGLCPRPAGRREGLAGAKDQGSRLG